MSGLNRVVTQFVDGWMVASLGAATVTGQSIGGLVSFMFESFPRGILSVVNTYVSQNLGAGRLKRCGQYTWAGALVAGLFVCVICPLAIFAGPIFSLIGHEPDVQAMEVLYFRYMVLSAPIALGIRVLEAFFYGVHRPGIVFAVSLFSGALNVFGNWVLIFGQFGLPALGLHGAAIASVLAWVVQLIILTAIFLSHQFHRRYGTRFVKAVRLRYCKEILRIGLPAGVSFLLDIATWSIFMTMLIGHFGKLHLTAASHAMRYMRLSFIPAIGIGIAATVLVGRYIGEGSHHLARRRAHAAVITGMIYMGLCGLAFILFRRPMIELFVRDKSAYTPQEAAQIVTIGTRILICMSVFQLTDAINIVLSGALRGAGDTRWPMWATGATSVVILVCGGCAMIAFVPELGSLGPFMAAAAYTLVLAAALTLRFRSGAWRRMDLLRGARPAKAVPPQPAPITPPTVLSVESPDRTDN